MSTESSKQLPWLSDKATRDLVVLKSRGLSFKKKLKGAKKNKTLFWNDRKKEFKRLFINNHTCQLEGHHVWRSMLLSQMPRFAFKIWFSPCVVMHHHYLIVSLVGGIYFQYLLVWCVHCIHKSKNSKNKIPTLPCGVLLHVFIPMRVQSKL